MGKRAVVLSGGGAKGGYQIGVWKVLRQMGFTPDIVVGTSVGALNGALMAYLQDCSSQRRFCEPARPQ